MDWALGVSTLVVNLGLGYFKGVWWVWIPHMANAAAWQVYVMQTNQMGLTVLNVATIAIDMVMMFRALKQKRAHDKLTKGGKYGQEA